MAGKAGAKTNGNVDVRRHDNTSGRTVFRVTTKFIDLTRFLQIIDLTLDVPMSLDQ
jgi:hypothetical protein